QVLQKCGLFVAGSNLFFLQVPGIQGLSAIQIDIDHAAAHQIDQWFVGIPSLQNRYQRPGTRHHQQLELREESLASAALGHDEHVRVAQSGIERRERYELAVGSLKEHQRR